VRGLGGSDPLGGNVHHWYVFLLKVCDHAHNLVCSHCDSSSSDPQLLSIVVAPLTGGRIEQKVAHKYRVGSLSSRNPDDRRIVLGALYLERSFRVQIRSHSRNSTPFSHMSDHQSDEETPLLGDISSTQPPPRKGNPLPKLQIAIVLLLQVCEPLTSQSIYPYINKVSTLCMAKKLLCLSGVYPSSSVNSTLLEVTNGKLDTMLG